MSHAEQFITIDRPIGEVFDYLADGTKNPQWRSRVIVVSRTSAQNGRGATYRQLLEGPGGRPINSDYRVTTFAPPHRLDFEVVAGPVRPTGSFQLNEAGPCATTVLFAIDVQPQGLWPPINNMIAHQMRREVEALADLKRCLEGRRRDIADLGQPGMMRLP